ncbi:putative aspartic protease [Rhypophila decipiens]|uniref:Aspartic protease n=1 Tax=Rhypophila decipiens TaxID=261697 RepID=A0AAN7B8G1_9PEZI|nr:putative aspartic protease [Rhypophila decipiens]
MSLVLSLRSAALSFLCCCLLSPFAGCLASAASHIQVPLSASGHVFLVNVTVGTPPQPLSLLLSPSSPHTWLPQSDAMPCTNNFDTLAGSVQASDDSAGSACGWGVFNPSTSSTNRMAEGVFVDFSIAYSDTMTVGGLNMTDTLTLGDAKLDALPMGIVTSVSNNQYIGMMGLNNDASTLYPRPSSRYRPNLIDQLVSSGKITTQAYSVWLDDPEGRSGALLLGAIDKSRYQGDLARLKTIQPYDIFPSAFAVSLNGVEVSGGKENFKYGGAPVAVTVNPAETFSFLPDALADSIITAAGATWDPTLKLATIPCDAASKTSTLKQISLKLQLQGPGGPALDVRMSDLVVSQRVTKWQIAMALLELDKNVCLFGIQKKTFLGSSNSNPQFNLGSSLLRRTYMVFDNVNKDIALAPVSPSARSAEANIIPFAKAGARIPSSKLYCIPDENESSSCLEESESDSDSDPASSGEGVSSTTSESSPSDKKAIIIGVVVPLVLLAILAPLGYLFFVRRRKRNRQRQAEALREAHMLHDDDEPDNFAEDEFGVKVTVSVSSKVSMMKQTPSPSPIRPDFGLGLPGGFNSSSSITPITEEKSDGHSGHQGKEKKGQYWGDAVLRAGGGGTSDGNLSARSVSR